MNQTATKANETGAISRKTPRFFQLLVHDDYTGERPGWYWQDDDCEEPMGPFSSYREAVYDHRDCRVSSVDSSQGAK